MTRNELLQRLLDLPGHVTESWRIPDGWKFFDELVLVRDIGAGQRIRGLLSDLTDEGIIDRDEDLFPRDDDIPASPPERRTVYLVEVSRIETAITTKVLRA